MIIRTYHCKDCDALFEVQHDSGDEPYPDCPKCEKVLDWRPIGFAIGGTNKGKAMDYTQKVLEQDYGLTDFKDNTREGESVIKMPVETTAQREVRELVEKEVAKNALQTPEQQASAAKFFGGSPGGPPQHLTQTFLAGAKAGVQGPDPMALLHKGAKSGSIPRGYVGLTEKGATIRRI
jgi:hypothetical protein